MINTIRLIEESGSGESYKSYQILVNGALHLTCQLSRKTVWEPVEFHSEDAPSFIIRPERKLLNRIWLLEDLTGKPIGQLRSHETGFTIMDADGDTLLQMGDPRRWQTRLVETALNGWPDRYAVAFAETEVGQIARRLRDGEQEPVTRLEKIKGLLKPRDWAAEFRPGQQETLLPQLVAGMLLLIEVTVRGARS